MIGSLGGEYGIILALDDTKKIAIPMGKNGHDADSRAVADDCDQVKNDLIFNRVEE